MPPWLICVFFIEMPPKLTTRRVCSSTSSMVGASFISFEDATPSTWGMITWAVPVE